MTYYPKDKYIDNSIGRDFIKEVVPVHTGTIIDFAGGWPSAPKRPI